MKITTLLIAIAFTYTFSLSKETSKPSFNVKDKFNIDSCFVNWNKATFASLQLQTTADEQSKVKAYYENRLATFHGYIGIKKLDEVNTNSVRYEFINLIKDKLQQKDVLVIEADKSGYRYVIKNYLVYLNNSNDINVEVYYSYNPGEWQIERAIKDYEQNIDTVLFHHREKWSKGFNNDDVIISHFINGQIKTSEFFLFGTLSKNGFEKIIMY